MKGLVFLFASGLFLMGFSKARPSRIEIQQGPYRVETTKCSPPLTIALVRGAGAVQVPRREIPVSMIGSDPEVSFYSDSACRARLTSFSLTPTLPRRNLFFMSSKSGQRKVRVSTSDYGDDSQYQTLFSSLPPPSPTPSPTPGNPTSQVVGVTLDDVSDSIRPGEISAIRALGVPIRSRVVFDGGVSATYYLKPLQELGAVSSIMGQIADSTDMRNYTAASYAARTESYVQTLKNQVEIWEIGNEVNGNWLGSGTFAKLKASYAVVKSHGAKAALTFFYMGEPQDRIHCIDAPGNDQFSWINREFQLGVAEGARNPESEAMRLGLDEVLVSWYPDGCFNIKPDWTLVFNRLASIFPNSRVGFGEIGTENPQYGSAYEKALIQEFYPLRTRIPLPERYNGGYYWWYFAEEMVPHLNNTLFQTLYQAIR